MHRTCQALSESGKHHDFIHVFKGALTSHYLLSLKKLKVFSHQLNSKIMIQFCYLGIHSGIETVSCRVLQRNWQG